MKGLGSGIDGVLALGISDVCSIDVTDVIQEAAKYRTRH